MSTNSKTPHKPHHAEEHRFAHDVDHIKESGAQLRDDVQELISGAAAIGKSGVAAAKSCAADAVENITTAIGKRMPENALLSGLIVFGAGYFAAKVLSRWSSPRHAPSEK
jgi:hypothetical protein